MIDQALEWWETLSSEEKQNFGWKILLKSQKIMNCGQNMEISPNMVKY